MSVSSILPRRLGAAAFTVVALLALSACSSNQSSAASDSKDFGTANIQLSYLKNTEFAGEYLAVEDGYFAEAGFSDVTLTSGGGSVSAESNVATGKALVGISSPLIIAPAIIQGAPLKVIAVQYQKNPFNIVSLNSGQLDSPSDLKGKTVAVNDFNSLVWQAFLTANDLTSADVTAVPATDGASQLASGQVDGWLSYTTGFTGTIGTQSLPAHQFLLADSGLPLVGEAVFATQQSIDDSRPELTALLKGLVQGWQAAIADPENAARLTVEKYGKDQDQDYDFQLHAMTVQTEALMTSPDTETNGLLTVTPQLQEQTVDSLKLAGVDITADQLFDLSLLDDVYKSDPSLIG